MRSTIYHKNGQMFLFDFQFPKLDITDLVNFSIYVTVMELWNHLEILKEANNLV